MPSLTLREAVISGTNLLNSNGVETARLDAEVLLAFILGISRTELYIKSSQEISEDKLTEYFSMLRRRTNREPVAYLTGEKEFMSLSFKVNSDVLIPRPETEMLVEEALAIKPLCVIDVGTGSGAIAVSIARYLPGCRVMAVDISAGALEVAKINASRNGVSDRLEFYHANLLEPFSTEDYFGKVDLITANLPYIPSVEMANLPVDVGVYEPHGALDGGFDGLELYRDLCPSAFKLLRKGGVLLLEFGYDQADALAELLKETGFSTIKVVKDLAGLNRIINAVK